jgi:hypothetical protein
LLLVAVAGVADKTAVRVAAALVESYRTLRKSC